MMDSKWTQPSFCKRYGSPHDLGTEGFGTSYYDVTKEVDVWVYTGNTRASNTYYGSANILSQEAHRVTLRPGDEVHVTCGGALWIVREGSSEAESVCTEDDVRLQAFTTHRALPEWRYGRKIKYVRK